MTMATLELFVVLLLSASVLCDDPIVNIISTDPPVKAVEGMIIQQKGKDVQISCVVENKPQDSEVQWTVENFRNNGSVVQIASATKSYDAFKWAIDTPSSTSWRLRIQNAQISSEGMYTCKVEVVNQINREAKVELRVVQKPEIDDIQTSTDMYFDDNDAARLECYATGHPPPRVTWTRLAGELLPNGGTALQSNVMYIPAIKSNHAGIYKCTAANSAGTDVRRILITVQFAPIVEASTPIVRQKVGYVKQLVCNVQGFPLPGSKQISWTREGVPVVPDERIHLRNIPGAYNRITSILDIREVRESDFGYYKCAAFNSKGNAEDSMELASSPVATKDRSNRIIAGSSVVTNSAFMTVMMVLSVWLLHRFNVH